MTSSSRRPWIKGDILADGFPASGRPPKTSRSKMIWGLALLFSGGSIQGKHNRDNPLYLASNRFHGKEVLALYRRRWGIGQVFNHFKKRGFDLETTHLSALRKIEKLFGVLTLAFMISYGWGCERKSKTSLTALQKRQSTFLLGLDRISQRIGKKEDRVTEMLAFLHGIEREKYHLIIVDYCDRKKQNGYRPERLTGIRSPLPPQTTETAPDRTHRHL